MTAASRLPLTTICGLLLTIDLPLPLQVTVAATCVAAGLYFLRAILIPLVLAVALKYLLLPMINVLTNRPLSCCGIIRCNHPHPFAQRILRARLPHWLAVLVALSVAFAVLGLLGFIVSQSVQTFVQRAPMYSARVQELSSFFVTWVRAAHTHTEPYGCDLGESVMPRRAFWLIAPCASPRLLPHRAFCLTVPCASLRAAPQADLFALILRWIVSSSLPSLRMQRILIRSPLVAT